MCALKGLCTVWSLQFLQRRFERRGDAHREVMCLSGLCGGCGRPPNGQRGSGAPCLVVAPGCCFSISAPQSPRPLRPRRAQPLSSRCKLALKRHLWDVSLPPCTRRCVKDLWNGSPLAKAKLYPRGAAAPHFPISPSPQPGHPPCSVLVPAAGPPRVPG